MRVKETAVLLAQAGEAVDESALKVRVAAAAAGGGGRERERLPACALAFTTSAGGTGVRSFTCSTRAQVLAEKDREDLLRAARDRQRKVRDDHLKRMREQLKRVECVAAARRRCTQAHTRVRRRARARAAI